MTLYTSDTEKTINKKQRFSRYAVFYLLFSAVCLIFSMVYEFYSHGVSSIYMRYLFLIPLVLGFVPCALTEYLKLPLPGMIQSSYSPAEAVFKESWKSTVPLPFTQSTCYMQGSDWF
ncbi:MAG: hypothetical protein LKF79_01530 [Solobacterium sp.]|nr:hypothetical protein [Solobacterium sp.]